MIRYDSLILNKLSVNPKEARKRLLGMFDIEYDEVTTKTRDILLLAIYYTRICTVQQLYTYLFTDYDISGLRKRLKKLETDKLIIKCNFKDKKQEGTNRYAYVVAKKGAGVIEQLTHNKTNKMNIDRCGRIPDRYILHTLGQSYVALSVLSLRELFDIKYEALFKYSKSKKQVFFSDVKGVIFSDMLIAEKDTNRHIYLEQDTGTEIISTLLTKLDTYYNAEHFSSGAYEDGCIYVSCNKHYSILQREVGNICTTIHDMLVSLYTEEGYSQDQNMDILIAIYTQSRLHGIVSNQSILKKECTMKFLQTEYFDYLRMLAAASGCTTIKEAAEWLKNKENISAMSEYIYLFVQKEFAERRMLNILDRIANIDVRNTESGAFHLMNMICNGVSIYFAPGIAFNSVIQAFLYDKGVFVRLCSKMLPNKANMKCKHKDNYDVLEIGVKTANCVVYEDNTTVIFEDISYDLGGMKRTIDILRYFTSGKIKKLNNKIYMIALYDSDTSRQVLSDYVGEEIPDNIKESFKFRFLNYNKGFVKNGIYESVVENGMKADLKTQFLKSNIVIE